MAVRNLSHLISLLALRGEIIFTFDQVKAHPLTQSQAATFEVLREAWGAVFSLELALRDGISGAHARVISTNSALNSLASRVSKALLTGTGDDRGHPLYIAYFKKKSLSNFKRPTLGPKLDAIRGWIQPLKESSVPALAALGAEVEPAVAAADAAVKSRAALQAEIKFFREIGPRKKLFNQVNAARKTSHAELATMPIEHMGLPASFADQFFRHDSGRNHGEAAPTLESVEAEMADLDRQIAEKAELYAELQAEAERAAAEEAERAATQAAIAELERAAAEADKKAAEARAKIAALSRHG